MANPTKIGECDACTADDVEVTSFSKEWYCPYCMVSYITKSSEGKTLSQMFNQLEKRLKEK